MNARWASLLIVTLATGCESPSSGTTTGEQRRASPPPVKTVSARPMGSEPAPRTDAPPQTFGGGDMAVEVAEAGDEPRQKLRYEPTTIERRQALAIELEPPSGMTLRIGLVLSWKRLPSGIAFAVDEAELTAKSGAAAGPQQAMFERMKLGFLRVKGDSAVSAGRQIRLTQNRGQTTTPPVPWILHSVVVPLPAEPMGVGAKWTVRQPIDTLGRKGTSERAYHLRAKEGDQLTVAISGTDRWKAAGGRADGTTTLSGESVISLDDPLPSSSKMTLVEKVEAGEKTPRGATTVQIRLDDG